MKLLLITREYPPFVKGGMCQVVEQMVGHCHRHNVDLTVVANHPDKGVYTEWINGVRFYRVPSLGATFLTQLPSFGYFSGRIVERIQHRFDVIYANFSPVFADIRKPLVAGFHATRYGQAIGCRESNRRLYALLNQWYIPFDRLMLRKADAIVVLCKKMISEIQATGSHPESIAVIPTGVDTDVFRPLSTRQFDKKEKTILYVGRLDAGKGIGNLIQAFHRIRPKVKARLVVAGGGKERFRLEALAKGLKLPVAFVGPVLHDQLPDLYNQADLFVFPSLYEGSDITLVVLEAMACGTPTLISDALEDWGIPRFGRNRITELAHLMETLLNDPDRLASLSEQCLALGRKHCWERVVDQTFCYIRRIASAGAKNCLQR